MEDTCRYDGQKKNASFWLESGEISPSFRTLFFGFCRVKCRPKPKTLLVLVYFRSLCQVFVWSLWKLESFRANNEFSFYKKANNKLDFIQLQVYF